HDSGVRTRTAAASIGTPRPRHAAPMLSNGKVLVAGGFNLGFFGNSLLATAELYDPTTGSWTTTGSLSTTRDLHTATLLSTGKVLVAGGFTRQTNSVLLVAAELYDPTTGTWTTTSSMPSRTAQATATLLSNGVVLIAGGSTGGAVASSLTVAQLYTP